MNFAPIKTPLSWISKNKTSRKSQRDYSASRSQLHQSEQKSQLIFNKASDDDVFLKGSQIWNSKSPRYRAQTQITPKNEDHRSSRMFNASRTSNTGFAKPFPQNTYQKNSVNSQVYKHENPPQLSSSRMVRSSYDPQSLLSPGLSPITKSNPYQFQSSMINKQRMTSLSVSPQELVNAVNFTLQNRFQLLMMVNLVFNTLLFLVVVGFNLKLFCMIQCLELLIFYVFYNLFNNYSSLPIDFMDIGRSLVLKNQIIGYLLLLSVVTYYYLDCLMRYVSKEDRSPPETPAIENIFLFLSKMMITAVLAHKLFLQQNYIKPVRMEGTHKSGILGVFRILREAAFKNIVLHNYQIWLYSLITLISTVVFMAVLSTQSGFMAEIDRDDLEIYVYDIKPSLIANRSFFTKFWAINYLGYLLLLIKIEAMRQILCMNIDSIGANYDDKSQPLCLTLSFMNRSGDIDEYLPPIIEHFAVQEIINNSSLLSNVVNLYFDSKNSKIVNRSGSDYSILGWNRIILYIKKVIVDFKEDIRDYSCSINSQMPSPTRPKSTYQDHRFYSPQSEFIQSILSIVSNTKPGRRLIVRTLPKIKRTRDVLVLLSKLIEVIKNDGLLKVLVHSQQMQPILQELKQLLEGLDTLNKELFSNHEETSHIVGDFEIVRQHQMLLRQIRCQAVNLEMKSLGSSSKIFRN